MITDKNRSELKEKGYTVVENVVTEEECNKCQKEYLEWLQLFPPGKWPQTKFSIIQKYSIGHLEPSWRVRLMAYPVFKQLWGTEKLLTSTDTVAIGRPPEDGEETFWSPEQGWLHCDQTSDRVGLHAYQGAVYLEHCDMDDWTFEVVEGSHNVFDEFMNKIQKPRCTKPSSDDINWLLQQGCERKRVSCPKGGMVLWDSRLVHANARPLQERTHPGRWRFVVFVCMTPSAWAEQVDLDDKRKAYENLDLTGHWASRGIIYIKSRVIDENLPLHCQLNELPEIATSTKVKRLIGILPYDGVSDEEEQMYIPKFKQ